MLRMSMAEKKIGLFGHIVRKKTALKKTDAWQGGRQAAKAQTRKDVVTGFDRRMDKAGHGGCIPTDRERWREIIKVTAAQIAPLD